MEKAKESKFERGAKWYRNVNILAGFALLGAGVVFPEAAPVLNTLAFIDFAQALGAEALRLVVSHKAPAARPKPA